MQFDDLLSNYLGDFGRYQRRVYLLICLPAVFSAFNMFAWTFSGADIPHRCQLSPLDTEYSMPYHNTTNTSSPLSLECHKPNQDGVMVTCNGEYVWDNSEIPPSALQEWELVCDRQWYKAMVQSVYYVGIFIGSLVFGHIADKHGRKPVLIIGCMIFSIVAALSVFSPNVHVFMVLRFIQGFLEVCAFQVPVIMGIELVGPSARLKGGMIIEFFFTGGLIWLGILAYFIRDWKTLQLIISLPGLLFGIYFWILPESPRWLLATGRKQEALAIIRKAAAVNNVVIPEEALENLAETNEDTEIKQNETYSYLDLVRTPNLRKKTLIMCYCWAIVTLIYYGISLNPSAIAGDFYTSFILASLVELPTLVFLILTLDRFGRRWLTAGGFLVCGVTLIAVVFVPSDLSVVTLSMVMLAKISVAGSFCVVYLYASEIFPTVLRSLSIGLTSTCARIGGIVSPFASIYLNASSRSMLLISFGVCSVIAALLIILLPETTNRTLPETLQDGEDFGNEPYQWCPLSKGNSEAERREGSDANLLEKNGLHLKFVDSYNV